MLTSFIWAINSHSELEERGIKTKASESMRQEHAIMRRDGITRDRKHAAAVLPSWVGWGGGARRQRVDTAGGPAWTQATRTRTTVRDIHVFHSQPLSLWSLMMPLVSHSPVFTSWLSVHRDARFVAMIHCHVTTNHSDQAVELHWKRRRCSSQAAHASSPPLAAFLHRIVDVHLLCNISHITSLSSKRVFFSCPNSYSHLIHTSISFSFFTVLNFTYLFCISCSDYEARVLSPSNSGFCFSMEAGYRPHWWPVCNFLLPSASCYILHLPLFPTVRSSWPWDLLLGRLCEYNNTGTWDFLWNLPFLLFA